MDELKPQEAEALDILEAMLDVCDLDNPGPMFAGQHVRGGICKIMDNDAAKLRQYIADRRAALENKPLTLEELRGVEGKPVWIALLNIAKQPTCEVITKICEDGIHTVGAGGSDYASFDLYAKTWLAYACKPEGSESI